MLAFSDQHTKTRGRHYLCAKTRLALDERYSLILEIARKLPFDEIGMRMRDLQPLKTAAEVSHLL